MNLPTPPSQQVPEKQLPRFTPGWQALTTSAVQAWLVLGLIGLGSGITWRLTGIGPTIFELFDGLGFAFWLVPWLLIGGWEQMRDRQTRHFSSGSGLYGQASANALKMVGYLLLISLAPIGLFTPFNQANPAAQFSTDIFDLKVGYPEFVLVTLLLSGTIVLCFSFNTLIGARRIFGAGFGVVVWGIVGAALNSSVLTGENLGRFNLSFGGLAEYARSALNSGLVDPAQIGYVTDTVRMVYGVLLVILLFGTGLLVLLQAPYNRTRTKQDVYLLPALVGMLIPAIYTFAHTSTWVNDPALAYPLPWSSLFITGLIPLLVVYSVSVWQQDHHLNTKLSLEGILLLWLCPLAWMAFAIPVVYGGQVGKLQLGFACTISMLLIFVWVLLSNFVAKNKPANPFGRSLLLAGLLAILVIPLTGSQHPGVALLLVDTASAFDGNQLLVAFCCSSFLVVLIGAATFALDWRIRIKRKQKPDV